MDLIHFNVAQESGGQPAQKNVLTHRQLQHDLPLLVDHADPGGNRLPRIVEVAGLAVDQIFAVVLLVIPIEDLEQGGLARAIFSHQGEHFAPIRGEADVVQSLHAGKVLRYVAEFNNVSHVFLPCRSLCFLCLSFDLG